MARSTTAILQHFSILISLPKASMNRLGCGTFASDRSYVGARVYAVEHSHKRASKPAACHRTQSPCVVEVADLLGEHAGGAKPDLAPPRRREAWERPASDSSLASLGLGLGLRSSLSFRNPSARICARWLGQLHRWADLRTNRRAARQEPRSVSIRARRVHPTRRPQTGYADTGPRRRALLQRVYGVESQH